MATANYQDQNNMNGPIIALIIMGGIILLAYLTYRYGIPVYFKERLMLQQQSQQQPSGSTINVKVNPTP